MADYEKLCEDLRKLYNVERGTVTAKRMNDAADAIEALQSECTKWKALGECANQRADDYREMRRQRDEISAERDQLTHEIEKLRQTTVTKESVAVLVERNEQLQNRLDTLNQFLQNWHEADGE